MPELPEVEIVRQSLDKKIRQKKVKKVIIRNQNLRIKVPNYFKRFLENKRIIKVKRFSKYLIFYLQNNKFCLIHLGMSGTIHLLDNKKKGTSVPSFKLKMCACLYEDIDISAVNSYISVVIYL